MADGAVVAESRHDGPGRPHAESLALQGIDAAGATLSVNLEPCTHEGKTPPCAPVVAASGLARVVVAMEDPDERVRGAGLGVLRDAGIEVEVGVLRDEALALNRAYVHHRLTGRPLITLKLAMTLDGRLGAADGTSKWISGPKARARTHARRAQVDAVMVGAGTVLADDPELTARDVGATRQPARIVVDAAGRVRATARIFAPGAPRIVASGRRAPEDVRAEWVAAGAEVLMLEERRGRVDLDALIKVLGSRDLLEVYCEGGGELATSLLAGDLVDRLEVYRGPVIVGRGGAEIGDLGIASMGDATRWQLAESAVLDDDLVAIYEKSSEG